MGKGKYSKYRPVFVSKKKVERLNAQEYPSKSKAQREADKRN